MSGIVINVKSVAIWQDKGMRVLLLSAILYLTGVALVLFLRPKLMFHPDGRWKEFGTGTADHTIFPFWLFCVLWGVLSYLITSLFVTEPIGATAATATAAATGASPQLSLRETEPPEDLVMPLPPKTRGRNYESVAAEAAEGNMKPGYYVLDPKGSGIDGIPKYIYIGAEPSEEEIAAATRKL
jgi:hypothetical protein